MSKSRSARPPSCVSLCEAVLVERTYPRPRACEGAVTLSTRRNCSCVWTAGVVVEDVKWIARDLLNRVARGALCFVWLRLWSFRAYHAPACMPTHLRAEVIEVKLELMQMLLIDNFEGQVHVAWV